MEPNFKLTIFYYVAGNDEDSLGVSNEFYARDEDTALNGSDAQVGHIITSKNRTLRDATLTTLPEGQVIATW